VVCDWLSDPEFAGHTAKAWYRFRNPGALAPVAVSFLDGVQTPTAAAADADFNKLSIQFHGHSNMAARRSAGRKPRHVGVREHSSPLLTVCENSLTNHTVSEKTRHHWLCDFLDVKIFAH
jgi:hypothetical protein